MKLEYIFPVNLAESLQQLKSLEIHDCSELKYALERRTRGDQIQNELKIKLPSLKRLLLFGNSKMISIFPQRFFAMWPSLSEFHLLFCPEFDIMAANTFKLQDVSIAEKHFPSLGYVKIRNNSKIESIFSLDRPDKIGQPVSISLEHLELDRLDRMKYICVGLKNSLTFRNLKILKIARCEKLVAVFPASVLRSLPELQELEIRECQELKQIIEEDDVENQKLPQPCFPKLSLLVIIKCDNLKRLFCVSASNDLPNLEYLVIEGASKLEELIDCEQGKGDAIGKVKAELPSLKFLVLVHLSNLCQGIELPTPTIRLVHDCPKLSLTSSVATRHEFNKLCKGASLHFLLIARDFIQLAHVFTIGDIGVEYLEGSTIQKLLGEIDSTNGISQSIEEDKIKESVRDVSTSEDAAKAAMSTDTEGNGLPGIAVTHTKTGTLQNQMMQNVDDSIQEGPNSLDKEGEICVASNGSLEVHPELEAFKHSADLDDSQIVLLAEAVAAYPHLWNGLDKFSTCFKALMLKTLADMLFFLRNESAASVTPQRENEFLKLCDEAEHGFDKSWVDEMRQRVRVRELRKMHDQLTQELCKIKEKFEKKCLDFL